MPPIIPVGRDAFETVREEILALEGLPDYRPRTDSVRVVEKLRRVLEGLREDKTLILMPFEPGLNTELDGLISSRLDLLASALLHAAGQDAVFSVQGNLGDLLAEARALRDVGFVMVEILAGIGLVDAGKPRRLRSGAGRRDILRDLEVLGADGLSHWAVLEPLQQHQPDPRRRLSREKLERMGSLAQELTQALDARDGSAGVNWRHLHIAAFEALTRAWDKTRTAARCAYRLEGDDEKADALVTLYGLGRR